MTSTLMTIEQELKKLNDAEKLWLLERIAHELRKNAQRDRLRSELAAMAQDPEIQREVRLIEEEFSPCLMDGLEEERNGDSEG